MIRNLRKKIKKLLNDKNSIEPMIIKKVKLESNMIPNQK